MSYFKLFNLSDSFILIFVMKCGPKFPCLIEYKLTFKQLKKNNVTHYQQNSHSPISTLLFIMALLLPLHEWFL